jgi:hypothetical protein
MRELRRDRSDVLSIVWIDEYGTGSGSDRADRTLKIECEGITVRDLGRTGA